MDPKTLRVSTSQLSPGLNTFQDNFIGGSVIMSANSRKLIRYVYSIAVILLAGLVSPRFTRADDLTGRVLDPQENRVAEAQLRLFDRNNGELRKTKSSSEGEFSFVGIPAGEYLLEADAAAALTGSRIVSVRGDQSVDLQLKISGTNTQVLVTASGTPLAIEEVAKAIDVVDSKSIDQRDELSISEAIRNIPGLRVQTLEGPGSLTSVRTRGLRAQDTAVLVDGMRFRDAASLQGDATAFLEDMTIVDTERIEVLRGSGSSLYGSNALAGVINISSRPGGGATHSEFRTEGGGLGIIRSVVGIGGGLKSNRFTYSESVAHLNVTKGVRDGSPYRNTGTQGAAKYSFTPGLSVGGRLWYDNNYLASTESPTTSPATLANGVGPIYNAVPLSIDQLERFEQKQPYTVGNATFIPSQIDPDGRRLGTFLSGAVNLQHQFAASGSYRVIYQRVNTKRTYIDGPGGPGLFEPLSGISRSSFQGYTDTLQARLDQNAGRYNLISAGYEFENEKYYSFNGATASTNSVDLRQRSHAVFAQDQIRLFDRQLQVTVAGRVQSFHLKPPVFTGFNNPFTGASTVEPPTAYTGDGAVAYFFRTTRTKIRAHVGNSFRAPSGFERFGGGSGTYYGDPRLAPERAVAVDGGIDEYFVGSKMQLNATYFYTNLQQTIAFENSLPAGDPFNRFFGYRNSGGGVARGFELGGRVSPSSRTTIEASYTYTNSDFRTPTIPAIRFYEALGISKHTFTLTATQWFAKQFSVAFDMSALSDYTSVIGSRAFKFDGPTKADVVFHYEHPISDKRSVDFYAKVENVFNQRHYENGFLGPKAWAIGGFKLKL
jgi:vitamin B12 transporter